MMSIQVVVLRELRLNVEDEPWVHTVEDIFVFVE